MKFAFSSLVIITFLHHAGCSVVMEASTQGIYVSDYCPKMKYCAEGSHVMCMYYNPNRIMGPRCTKPKNVTVTPTLAEQLLEISNGVRSKIAQGKEKGKGGELFPRGYGMFRLKWDSELATFAQILANQCVLRHDMCRATKQFPDPGQTAGLVRFTYPEWEPLNKHVGLNKPGLNQQKLSYAIKQALKSWYGQKSAVTVSMITNTPDWDEDPSLNGRLYMEMIYGPATHMGCGMSAYSEYAYYDNNAALNYNAIQIICNYSHRSRKGGALYEMAPPSQVGYTVKCGCPVGMDEDGDCLCYESSRDAVTNPPVGRCANKDENCKPAVVLLPIFTVENAPLESLARAVNEDKKESEIEIMDLYQPPENNSLYNSLATPKSNFQNVQNINIGRSNMIQPYGGSPVISVNDKNQRFMNPMYNKPGYPSTALQIQDPSHTVIKNLVKEVHHKVNYPLANTPKPHIFEVKNRFFEPKPLYSPNKVLQHIKKGSLFAKVPTFELSKKTVITVKPKTDVLPRKDFSNAKSLVKQYLTLRRYRPGSKPELPTSSVDFLKLLTQSTTEPHTQLQNSAEEKVINYNSIFKNKLNSKPNKAFKDVLSEIESDSSKEKAKDQFMTLLDKLEQEVKHIELDKNKKQLFDAKLRKIYGSVVGKIQQMSNNKEELTELELLETEKRKSDHEKYMDAENGHDKLSQNSIFEFDKNYETEIRLNKRVQNSLSDQSVIHPGQIHTNKEYGVELKRPYNDIENVKSTFSHDVFNDENEIKSRSSLFDKEALRVKKIYSEAEEKKRVKDLEKQKHATLMDNEDDPLGIDRRKFYQDKLDKIVRRVHNTRKFKHRNDANTSPLVRPIIRPSRVGDTTRTGKSPANPFYMPDRARFLHGF